MYYYLIPAGESSTCSLLSFTCLVIILLHNIFRSLCKVSLSLRESTAPPRLVATANLLNVHLIHMSTSLKKTIYCILCKAYCHKHQKGLCQKYKLILSQLKKAGNYMQKISFKNLISCNKILNIHPS